MRIPPDIPDDLHAQAVPIARDTHQSLSQTVAGLIRRGLLLDANVLDANVLVDDHVHHAAAENWFVGISGNFATCPITQGSLMRLLIGEGQSAATAQAVLSGTTADSRHEFWPDDLEYASVRIEGIIGHRQ